MVHLYAASGRGAPGLGYKHKGTSSAIGFSNVTMQRRGLLSLIVAETFYGCPLLVGHLLERLMLLSQTAREIKSQHYVSGSLPAPWKKKGMRERRQRH